MKQFFGFVALGLMAALMVSCGDKSVTSTDESLTIGSSSFTANGPLPDKYTCAGHIFGTGIAPELNWTAGPKSTLSYAIVFKDLSIINSAAPDHAFHWMIWDIPASIRTLPEGLSGDSAPAVMGGARQFNGGPTGGFIFLGPCPSWMTYCSKGTVPAETDIYSFTIYAFDVKNLAVPAKDTTISFVRQMDNYFNTKAIAMAEVRTTSSAVPDSLPFPCP